ncbi:hypothetical protein [Capnocytophaga canimorsus]|uniref:hypothetical protein n=1 Tax=Capnocytophaga canimorsus TaxID=28188 RepID=UPI0037D137B9
MITKLQTLTKLLNSSKMNSFVLFYAIFISHITIAQKTNTNDTIYLPEVIITQHQNKKLKKISNLGKADKVSFSSVIPNTFYANKIVTKECIQIRKVVLYVKKKSNLSTNENFELLFFSVGKEGFPEKKLHNETLFFKLLREDKIEISLEKINLPLCQEFFIVVQKTLDKDTSESNYILLGNRHKKSQTFIKIKDKNWYKLNHVNLMLDIYYTENKN